MRLKKLAGAMLAGTIGLGAASAAMAQECLIILPFDFNSASVSDTNRQLLEVVRQKYDNTTVGLAGHADAVGSDAYNLRLSEQRAQTVENYITNGTSINVVRITALGESDLKVQTLGPSQVNRRVEVMIENCNPADFGQAVGQLDNRTALAALGGALLVIFALGDGGSGTTTTTTTTTGASTGGALN